MLIRGSVVTLSTVVLPFYLSRNLPKATFDSWVVIVGLIAWVPIAELGLFSGIVRFLATASSSSEQEGVIRAAKQVLVVPFLVGVAGAAWSGAYLAKMYPTVGSLRGAGLSLFVGGTIMAFSLFSVPSAAYFVAMNDTKFLAISSAIGRLLLLCVMFLCVKQRVSLFGLVVAHSLLLLSVSVSPMLWRNRLFKTSGKFPRAVRIPGLRRDILNYAFSSGVWSVSAIILSAFDTLIVGRVDASDVGAYALCLSVTVVLSGFQAALLAPVVGNVSRLCNGGEKPGRWLISAATGSNLLLSFFVSIIVLGSNTLRRFSGPAGAQPSFVKVLIILSLANFVRLLGAPYSTGVMGTGEHRKIILSPILEAVFNLSFSIVLGIKFGSVGVAIGTLIGALFCLAMHLIYNMRRTMVLGVSSFLYFTRCLLPGMLMVSTALLFNSVFLT
jgi:O-antigen/teichoic acid export membrane protein